MALSPHEDCAGAIVPVQEGFLFISYKTVDIAGVMYNTKDAFLLTASTAAILRNERLDYTRGLTGALNDIIAVLGVEKEAGDTTEAIPIIIEVKGGLVQQVYAPEGDMAFDVVVADYDNLEAGSWEEGLEPHDEAVDRAEQLRRLKPMKTVY